MSSPDLTGRSFLRELDHTPRQWRTLLDLAARLKADNRAGTEQQHLLGKSVAMVCDEAPASACEAFGLAARDQGAEVTRLDPPGSPLGLEDLAADSARALGRAYDGIGYLGSSQRAAETLATSSGVPVWSGLTDEWHPTQSLCDVLTVREHTAKPESHVALAFVGDARDGTASSLLVAGALMGMDVRMVAPGPLGAPEAVLEAARRIAGSTGARITVTEDLARGTSGVDFVYAGVGGPVREPAEARAERIGLLAPFRVTAGVMAATGNPYVELMHSRAGSHGRAAGLPELEVAVEVLRSRASIVLRQAENLVHTVKAVMVATLGGTR